MAGDGGVGHAALAGQAEPGGLPDVMPGWQQALLQQTCSLPSSKPHHRLCGGDLTCVMILLSFAGQGRPFPGEAKGSPESGERLAWPRALLNLVAETWRALHTLPLGLSPSRPIRTPGDCGSSSDKGEVSAHIVPAPAPRTMLMRPSQGPSHGRTSQLHPPQPEKGGRSWGNPFSIPSHHTAQHRLRQSSDSKSLPTHLDSMNHRIPADRGTSRDSTTTTTTADPGHGPRGCPETNTQPGVGATAWTTHQ